MALEFSRQKNYRPAIIRGFTFLATDENTSGGQKVALHEYPNRNDRFAEPLGDIPKILGLTAKIHGEDYFQRRLDFEKILNTPGVTELTHPFYGPINVQPGPWIANATQKETGVFIFNLTFYTSVGGIGPTALPAIPSAVSKIADDARIAVGNALEGLYNEPADGDDLEIAADETVNVLDSIQDGIDSVVGPIEDAIASANSEISSFRDKVFKIVNTPAALRNSFDDLFNNMKQLTLDPAGLAAIWEETIDFGVNDEPGPTDTVKRNRNEANKAVIAEYNRVNGLIGLMESQAFTEFGTSDDIIASSAVTDDRFNAYFQEKDQLTDSSLSSDPNVRATVLQLRASLKTVLDGQLSNVWRTVTEKPGRSSMALTAYRYYGDHETLENIINLNPGLNSANFNKEITLVTK